VNKLRSSSQLKPNNGIRSRIVLLAPVTVGLPFRQIRFDGASHSRLLSEAQKLRGSVYLQDSAIEPWELSADGRHIQAADNLSWHVLTVDEHEQVTGCLRYLQHHEGVVFSELALSTSAVANSRDWASIVRKGIEAQISDAARRGLSYVELGGWAISEGRRLTSDALRMILSVYALAGLTGSALAVTTATKRHESASILRRMGGWPLNADGHEVPPYYDTKYGCEMELLVFDSTSPNPNYEAFIEDYQHHLPECPVILPEGFPRQIETSFDIRSLSAALEESDLHCSPQSAPWTSAPV
jgi:hypothetical protein